MYNHWHEKIFSVKNDKKRCHKIWTILGIKLKFKSAKLFEKKLKKLTKNNKFEKIFYGQDGEDAVLWAYYETTQNYKGFYVDVGALHPARFSNTYSFYKKGWRGINIDATPGSMKEFDKIRPQDINIEAVISANREKVTYYMFEEPALNSFDKEISEERIAYGWKLKNKVELQTQNINDILDKNLPKGATIDFIDIDIEGIDYEVICSLDYTKYAPKFFIVEELEYTDKDFVGYEHSKMYKFLSEKGYKVLAKTKRSVIYGK